MFAKFEADRLCQNTTYITTKDSGFRVSLPLFCYWIKNKLLLYKGWQYVLAIEYPLNWGGEIRV